MSGEEMPPEEEPGAEETPPEEGAEEEGPEAEAQPTAMDKILELVDIYLEKFFGIPRKSPYLEEDPSQKPPITDTLWFNSFVAVVAILNVFALGLETDLGCFLCDPSERVSTFAGIDLIFAVLFGLELVVRMAVGQKDFILSQRRIKVRGSALRLPDVVNLLDILLVLSRVAGMLTSSSSGMVYIKLLSMLRVFRVAAVFESFRLDPRFREIVLIVLVSRSCAKVLLCFVVLATPVIWATAILMTVAVGQSDEAEAIVDYSDVEFTVSDFWGTVPRSAFTLFQILTLDRWSSVLCAPVFREYPGLYILVFSFLGIGVLALANLIISIVVSNTCSCAKMLQEEELKEKVAIKKKVMESLRLIFAEGDEDRSGELDEEELDHTRENEEVQDRLQMLGIPLSDLEWVFRLFSENSEKPGDVPISKFFRGCSRIQGPAMANDLQSMSVDFERNIKRTVTITEGMEHTNQLLANLLDDIEEVDRDVIKGNADHKDPVLAARRARAKRPKWKESRIRRGWASTTIGVMQSDASRDSSKRNSARSSSHAPSVAQVNSMGRMSSNQSAQVTPPNPHNALTDGMRMLGDSALVVQTIDYEARERERHREHMREKYGERGPPPPELPTAVQRQRFERQGHFGGAITDGDF